MFRCIIPNRVFVVASLAGLFFGCGELQDVVKRYSQAPGTPQSIEASQSPPVPSDPWLVALANGPFGGITIIDMNPSSPSQNAGRYLIVFVSPGGTYARSLTSGGLCIGWVSEANADPSVLSFGLNDTSNYGRVTQSGLRVCHRHTLQFESESIVRVIQGQQNRKYNIVARIPLQMLDWSHKIFEKHAIKGVRLGPTSSVKRAVPFNTAHLEGRVFAQFRTPDPTVANPTYSQTIFGHAAVKEITGWPSDILVMSRFGESLGTSGRGSAFNAVVLEKYGQPSFLTAGQAIWVYDLHGKKLQEKDAGPANCLGTYQAWEQPLLQMGGVPGTEDDIGPWGCSLVVTHTYADDSALIGSYQVRTFSGQAWAMSRFKGRLFEVKEAKETISSIDKFKPKF